MNRSAARPVYQIDFTAVACGKRVASSKRRVRWRFGFANARALASGLNGTDCRGEEHDVTFVWSISSGKRTIIFDGQEVHFSSSRSGIFDHSWTLKNTNHVLKIVAHATPPMSTTPGFRQYDFFVDGLSFFRFPKVFRLGLNPNDPRAAAAARGHSLAERGKRYSNPDEIIQAEIPSNPDEEEAYLQEAIRQSLQDDEPAKGPAESTDLLGFDSPAPPQNQTASPNTLVPYVYGAPPPSQYALPFPGAETPFGYAQQPPQQQPALPASTSINPPFASDPWAPAQTITAQPPAPPAYQQPHQTGYATQQPFSNEIVPAPSAPSPYAGMVAPIVGQQNNPFGYSPQPPAQQATTVPTNSYPVQQQQQTPAPYSNVTASYQSGGGDPTGGSGYATSNPSSSQWSPPPPIVTTTGYAMPSAYGAREQLDVPSAVSPQAVSTPSTLGFGSPAANFAGFASPPPATFNGDKANAGQGEQQPTMQATELFSDNFGDSGGQSTEATQTSSVVDAAYSKLIDFESFSISSKKDANRSNPFEMSSSIGGTKSLADMRAMKQPGEKKEVMKTPVPAMAEAPQQSAAYGTSTGYAQRPGAYTHQPAPQPVQPQAVQFSSGYMQQQEAYPQSYGAPPPNFGYQQPPQSFVQQQFTPTPQQHQLPQAPPQQAGYGQQPSGGPQSTYGQPPTTQPSVFGQTLSYF